MHQNEKARLIAEHIIKLDAEHGVPVELNDAPPGVTARLIKVEPRWQATIMTGITARSVPIASSRAEALLWQRALRGILPNALDLWVDGRKVFAAQFDGALLRVLFWKSSGWDRLFRARVPDLA